MKTALIVLATVGAFVAILVGVITTRPAYFCVERITTIVASKASILDHVVDLHKWALWSPYEGKDPNMNRTYSGAQSGEGAVYEWSGNRQVGAGRMTIQEVKDNSIVFIALEMFKPVSAKNNVTFTLGTADNGSVSCDWVMESEQGFVGKAVGLVMDMDALIGTDFGIGLANLKNLLESKSDH